MASSIGERLQGCFRTVFPALGPDEIRRASTESVGSWDSLATVTLVALIEEEFGVTISPRDYEDMVSFDLVARFLQGKRLDA